MSAQPRVSILYPAKPGARFDFSYYVPNHLPLAVGTSLRHAAITCCDASRPVSEGSPYACICTVGFDTVAAMDDFRHFFATGHPETVRILADEPNYTNITPVFVAGMAHGITPSRPTHESITYRMQLVFPAVPGMAFPMERFRGYASTTLKEKLGAAATGMTAEVDAMVAGVLPDSAPDIHCIWTAWVANRQALDTLAAIWQGPVGDEIRGQLHPAYNVSPQAVFAEVSTLDMALAHRVARNS